MTWRKAMTVWGSTLRSPVTLATLCVFTIVGTVSGAFGSGFDPLIIRRAFWWLVVVTFAVIVGTGIKAFVQVVLQPRTRLAEAILIAALSAALITPALDVIAGIIYPRARLQVPNTEQMFWFVVVSALSVTMLRMSIEHSFGKPEPAPPPAAETPRETMPALLRRLDAALHGPLVRIEADDHYVQVHTVSGSARLLMRLGDALEEVFPAEGLRVHRKHWVACDAIRAVVREAGKLWLHLHDGAVVPVSKSYQEAVVRLDLPSGKATELAPVSTASASGPMSARNGA